MGWRKGLKLFGERGGEVGEDELQQIHDMKGFQPKHWCELIKEGRTKALKYLMYLKEKRDGRIKGRGYVGSRQQQEYTKKSDTSLPTTLLAALLLTCTVDAFKRRDITTVDTPGALLQTKMPKGEDVVYIILYGQRAELLAKIAPGTHQEYVHQRQG